LPNVASPIIVRATIGMGYAILTAAVLGFLGMGAPPPQPEWGLMVAESRDYLPDAWWFAAFPGLAIFLVVFAFNLLGDGLRDIVDPRLRRSRRRPKRPCSTAATCRWRSAPMRASPRCSTMPA